MAKRLKKVFGRFDQITHLWANQTQETAKCRNGFFEGRLIYSYGRHFLAGVIVEPKKIVLTTTRTYSSTTAGHMRDVRYSVNHFKHHFRVPYLGETITAGHHRGNMEDYAIRIKNLLFDARNSKKKAQSLLLQASAIKSEALSYARVFKVSKSLRKLVLDAYQIKGMKALIEKQAAYIKMDDARINERTIKARITRRENWQIHWGEVSPEHIASVFLPAWLENKGAVYLGKERSRDSVNRCINRQPHVYLRVNGDNVETSRGASVSLRAAHLLFEMIKGGHDIKGYDIDGYTVISMNGVLQIGCHKIERAEINRFAASQGWGQIEIH